jgi:hypothetical protein
MLHDSCNAVFTDLIPCLAKIFENPGAAIYLATILEELAHY